MYNNMVSCIQMKGYNIMITIVYITQDERNCYAHSDSNAKLVIEQALRVHTFSSVTIYTSTKNVIQELTTALLDKRIQQKQIKICIESCNKPQEEKPKVMVNMQDKGLVKLLLKKGINKSNEQNKTKRKP